MLGAPRVNHVVPRHLVKGVSLVGLFSGCFKYLYCVWHWGWYKHRPVLTLIWLSSQEHIKPLNHRKCFTVSLDYGMRDVELLTSNQRKGTNQWVCGQYLELIFKVLVILRFHHSTSGSQLDLLIPFTSTTFERKLFSFLYACREMHVTVFLKR